jgi:SAM-dependent methyltransferase
VVHKKNEVKMEGSIESFCETERRSNSNETNKGKQHKMKYNYAEYEKDYQLIAKQGKNVRSELFDKNKTFDSFYMKTFLDELIDKNVINKNDHIFEYGTGTGPVANYLSNLGFNLTAIDISPSAINIAVDNNIKHQNNVAFFVDDISNPINNYESYEIILDSYCLQSIVFKEEREVLYNFVKQHLKTDGKYILEFAGFSNKRDYSKCYIDEKTGIIYRNISRYKKDSKIQNTRIINGIEYVPYRRHFKLDEIEDELEENGFKIVYKNHDIESGTVKIIASK